MRYAWLRKRLEESISQFIQTWESVGISFLMCFVVPQYRLVSIDEFDWFFLEGAMLVYYHKSLWFSERVLTINSNIIYAK